MKRRGPFWLGPEPVFPPPELADVHGLLAVGGDLAPERLLAAYRAGIFPWPIDEPEAPLLWFSPDPRFVLEPHELHVSRSLRRLLRTGRFEVRFDTAFETVMQRCAQVPRHGQEGSWITPAMLDAYRDLHGRGWAHSAECWEDGVLVGGVYGLAIGSAFFAESMFFLRPDASKVALVALVSILRQAEFELIDCQQESEHVGRFGARLIPRSEFLERLEGCVVEERALPDAGRVRFDSEFWATLRS